MLITVETFSQIAGKPVSDNMISALRGLQFAGVLAGLNQPHRLAQFLAQTAHESMGWRYDREIWGPTPAQKRYEGRKDLGNTQPGDGAKFRGYTPMQITGRYNTTNFHTWCKKEFPELRVPDFTHDPSLMNTDPWEGIGPIWYWLYGKPAPLNVEADKGDFKRLTYKINGGYNGLGDRYRYLGRAALVLLGRSPDSLKEFQAAHKLVADGICGEKTAAVLIAALRNRPEVQFNEKETKTPIRIGFIESLIILINNIMGRK